MITDVIADVFVCCCGIPRNAS